MYVAPQFLHGGRNRGRLTLLPRPQSVGGGYMGRRGCYSYCYFYILMQFLNMAPKHNCYKSDYGLCYSPDLSRWGWGGLNGQVRGVFYIVFFQERPEVTMFMFMGKWLRVKMVLMQVFILEASLTLVIYLSDTNLVYQKKGHARNFF